ncbi:MAG: hypothetical protein DRJ42_19645 [Deltaproteobacteria bacterium]|nr:MAG: hypothetical protein DRJ42_19645 [Deltaproteobacteria bacterium]
MAAGTSNRKSGRVLYIDLLRLLATFQMVQGHSLDAVLAEELRAGWLFDRWTWVRGLTSVAFLFAAGISFHLATLTRFEAHRANPKAVARRVKRGLLLVGIGYLLHNPFGAVGGDAASWMAALEHAAIVDVLQCIGVSILILEALVVSLPSARHVVWASVLLAALFIGSSPVTAGLTVAGPGAFLTNYLGNAGGSIFPLFPWAGYLFAGVVAGAVACPAGIPSFGRQSVVALGGFALLVAFASWAIAFVPYGAGAPNPGPGLLKLAAVVALSAVLAGASLGMARLPRPLTILAGETLIIYVVHIALLYGAGYGLAEVVGPTLGLGASLGVAAVMLVGSALLGLGWHRAKARWSRADGRLPVFARRAKAG